MAIKPVDIRLGQSNEHGLALKDDLDPSLRGPQANTFIWNNENLAIEILNCDGVGANLPNSNPTHFTGVIGPVMRNAQLLTALWGESYTFQFAAGGSGLCYSTRLPSFVLAKDCWDVEAGLLFEEFKTRFLAFVAALAALGHTPDVRLIQWTQGETDASIEGADYAYYGLFKHFIAKVREFLVPYTTLSSIPFITGLIHNYIYAAIAAGIFNYGSRRTVDRVRAAQRKVGYNDASYRVVDMDKFSYQPDNLHLDTAGCVNYGEAQFNQYLSTVNNTMALEDYNLGSIRQWAIDEFGIDPTDENIEILNNKINLALSWIANRRKTWPTLDRVARIAIGEQADVSSPLRRGCAIFTRGSTTAQQITSINTQVGDREFISFSGEIDPTMVVDSATGSCELDSPFQGDSRITTLVTLTRANPTLIKISLTSLTGETISFPSNFLTSFPVRLSGFIVTGGAGIILDGNHQATRVSNDTFSLAINSATTTYSTTNARIQIGRQFDVLQGLVQLPDDFMRGIGATIKSNISNAKLNRKNSATFENIVRDRLVSPTDRCYTIIPDPLRLVDAKFAWIFPYYSGKDILTIKYYGDPIKLVSDDDVPFVPRGSRFLVVNAVGWFIAQWRKDTDLIAYWRDGALGELKEHEVEAELTDDPDTSYDNAAENADLGIPQSPGFGEFRLP